MQNHIESKIQTMKGFTLVELLIVVIILAILAAIVVPQFASSTDDAKVSSLDSTLANMRSAISLYKQQHTAFPGELVSSGGGTNCTGVTGAVVGTGAVNTEAAFLDQLAYYSNAAGQSCTAKGAANEFPFGPYLQKREVPLNSITNSKALAISTAGLLGIISTETSPGLGWKYDTGSGQFIADDANTDANSVEYYKH